MIHSAFNLKPGFLSLHHYTEADPVGSPGMGVMGNPGPDDSSSHTDNVGWCKLTL